jgi:chromosome segregation ATPase
MQLKYRQLESEYESRVQGECSEVTVKLSTVEAELLSLQSENGVLVESLTREKESNTKLNSEHLSLLESSSKLNSEYLSLLEKLIDVEAALSTVTSERDALTISLSSERDIHRSDHNSMMDKLNALEAAVSTAVLERDNLSQSQSREIDALAMKTNEYNLLLDRVSELETTLSTTMSEKDALTSLLNSEKENSTTIEGTNRKLMLKLKAKMKECTDIAAALSTLQEACSKSSIDDTAEKTQLMNQVLQLETQIKDHAHEKVCCVCMRCILYVLWTSDSLMMIDRDVP